MRSGAGLSVPADLKGAQDWEQLMGGHKAIAPLLELGELLGLLAISY